MTIAVDCVLWLLVAVGHVLTVAMLVNYIHGGWLPRWFVRPATAVLAVVLFGCPAFVVYWMWNHPANLVLREAWRSQPLALNAYLFVCLVAAIPEVAWWTWARAVLNRQSLVVRSFRSHRVDVVKRLGYRPTGGLLSFAATRVPLNEVFDIEVNEKQLAIPRLPQELAGVSIVHLTDFHVTGRIGKEFYEIVTELTNELDADLVALTGDILDHERYLDWIPSTVGRLSARYGVYFVLGNHDRRSKVPSRVRSALVSCNQIDLGNRWQTVELRGQTVLMAGNEFPWMRPLADLSNVPRQPADGRTLSILLSHSPDQFRWACQNDFDLVMAGHVHGGQIRFPVAGPLFVPSKFGPLYAGGVFSRGPSVMHVSRGISAVEPFRLNCRPELTRLVLVPAAEPTSADDSVSNLAAAER